MKLLEVFKGFFFIVVLYNKTDTHVQHMDQRGRDFWGFSPFFLFLFSLFPSLVSVSGIVR